MTTSQVNRSQLPPIDPEKLGAIVRIDPARRSEAILRLVAVGGSSDPASAERFMQYAKANAVCLEGLWSQLDGQGRVAFSVLAVPNPGRTAMVFASHPASAEQVAPVSGLIDHACRELDGWDIDLTQSLQEPREELERQAFLGAGFTELAMLSYLERSMSRRHPCPPPTWPQGVRTEPYADALFEDLATTLELSYQQTLDCPGLYGLRRTKDIIAGHMSTGSFDAALWTLLRVDDKPAGALLLNAFPDHRTVELVYLGLAPFARGRGLGGKLLDHGLWLLNGRRERCVTLAVDERNAPALSVYTARRFQPVLQRVALIRPLRRAEPAC